MVVGKRENEGRNWLLHPSRVLQLKASTTGEQRRKNPVCKFLLCNPELNTVGLVKHSEYGVDCRPK